MRENPGTDALVLVPPLGLRWEDDGQLVAKLRPKRSLALFYVLGAIWNFTIGFLLYLLGVHRVQPFMWVGLLATAGFLAFAFRAVVSTTSIGFAGGRFLIRPGPLSFWLHFDAAIADITGFAVVQNEDTSYEVFVVHRSGARQKLPIDLEGFTLVTRGSGRRLWTAPRTHADFVVARLEQMLEDAQRTGHDTYRS